MKTEDENQDFPNFLSTQNRLRDPKSVENGFILNHIYLPEEILLNILSYVEPKQLLNYTLVCGNWNRLIKSYALWSTIYERKYQRKAKLLPWYLYYYFLSTNYFDANLLLNNDKITFWTYRKCDPPVATVQELEIESENVFVMILITSLDIQNYGWCGTARVNRMMTSYHQQCFIKLGNSKLFKHILDTYKPHIYLSKCGNIDKLEYGYLGKDISTESISNCSGTQPIDDPSAAEQLTITQYPEGIQGILFESNRETNYSFNDLYGNSSVKLLFDSIEPLPVTIMDKNEETNK